MLFTLVRNEFVKIFKKAKTWIVFALFALCIVGTIIISNINAKNMRYYMSPQGQIESLNEQIGYSQGYIDDINRYNKDEPWASEQIESEQMRINSLKEDIKRQEERIKNENNPNQWKEDLKDEKEDIELRINDESIPDRYKSYDKQRLAEINTYLEKNIEPIPNWEFDAANYSLQFMSIIGLIILAAGISVFMSDIVSGESTPPTLKFLLVQPISRGKVLLSKFIAVVLTVVTMIGSLQILAFGVVGAIGGFSGMKMLTTIGIKYSISNANGYPEINAIEGSGVMATRGEALLQSFGLQILFIIACCAFIFAISAIFKSSMITMALSVIISVASTMICMMSSAIGGKFAHLIFLNYGNTPEVISGNITNMFYNVNFSIGLGIALMIFTTLISYFIAHVVFTKKDILI